MKRIITGLILIMLLLIPVSCTDDSPGELHTEIAGRWDYAFPQGYDSQMGLDYYSDPEGGLIDAITITTVDIDKKGYLILSFDPLFGADRSRFFIFDTENPHSPRLISTIEPEKLEKGPFLVRGTTLHNNILYASLFLDKGLWMVDVSDPHNPRDLGIAPVEITSNIIVSGEHAYASGQLYNGISVSDISDTQDIREVARIDLPSRDCRLAVNDDLLFVGIDQTLTVYDISLPSSPRQVGACELAVSEGLVTELPFYMPGEIHWRNWASIIDVQASGDYVYVTFGAGQLRVIDVSDPASPVEVAAADLGGFAIALTLKDDVLYVTKSDTETQVLQLCIVDISNPESPGLLDTVVTESVFGFGGASLAYCWMRPQVIGNYVYVASVNYMDVIEIR